MSRQIIFLPLSRLLLRRLEKRILDSRVEAEAWETLEVVPEESISHQSATLARFAHIRSCQYRHDL